MYISRNYLKCVVKLCESRDLRIPLVDIFNYYHDYSDDFDDFDDFAKFVN